MTQNSDTPWAHIFRDKYYRGVGDLHNASARGNSSTTWRGIVEHLPMLWKGVGSAVADGQNTMFWSQLWVSSQPSKDLALQPIPSNKHSTKVADYWDEDRGWRWEELSDYLPPNTLKEIASFELAQDTGIKDDKQSPMACGDSWSTQVVIVERLIETVRAKDARRESGGVEEAAGQ
ncbi:hypothetical protein Cgig2_022878 [Carnegiea gigantea]|uniref:Uncharacterized protein n=1 Tax=Carnegiea gigantea TaxID=171969 RepID=A0A9Q1QME1_9CARY|nr:hypothetical protein Cgig2_022878 [Carnegiea gigantea]